jgi:hypothetical protein
MDLLILPERAQDARLRLEVPDTSLKISGPRKTEPLVRLLAEHKAQVLDALRKVQEVQKVQGTESRRTSTERDPGPFASAHAEAFGWTERDLFGLPDVPDRPRPKYQRLSRYDQTGLVWLLQGRRVVELTKDKAVIETPTGTVAYRRYNKPALGPLGDSLDDFAPGLAAIAADVG